VNANRDQQRRRRARRSIAALAALTAATVLVGPTRAPAAAGGSPAATPPIGWDSGNTSGWARVATGTAAARAGGGPAPTAAAAAYPDPGLVTGNVTVHDPAAVRGQDGVFSVFSTHNGVEIRTSTDRVAFTRAGSVLPNGATWATQFSGNTKDIWAPDVSFHNGTYYLYYSVSTFGSNNSAIGLATSPTARAGSWTDRGLVYSSATSGNFNAIDPNLVLDAGGRWWLAFGSWWTGIKMIQLDPATGKQLASNQTRVSLASRTSTSLGIEAPFVFRHGGFYYLFVSWDLCCRGVNSTYRVMVGRSANITGPYTDRAGVPMASGGGTELVATHGRFIGPGGQSVITDGGQDLLVYHYYDGNDRGTPKLGINLLGWDAEGWPVLR
jgi:arabinan endo-1,5-alpha-L-arabinosidase